MYCMLLSSSCLHISSLATFVMFAFLFRPSITSEMEKHSQALKLEGVTEKQKKMDLEKKKKTPAPFGKLKIVYDGDDYAPALQLVCYSREDSLWDVYLLLDR